MKNNIKLITLSIIFLIIGILVGAVYFGKVGGNDCVTKLKLLKKNIDCVTYDDKTETLYKLENKLTLLADGYKKTGKVKRISVFVRDLNTSRFAGFRDDEIYYMASLLKTPLVIGGFKLAEVEPKILEQVVKYNGNPNLYDTQVIKSDEVLRPGQEYTIKDLMRRSVIYSDNTAAQILFDFFPDEFLSRIMQALGIQITRPDGEVENLITARTYANMFRMLYNASYLTKEYSNETLEILTETKFKNGAASKLPKDEVIAHKFGERTLLYENGNVATKQFHECGIVYAKNGDEPYIFCIMTEGMDYDVLQEIIADVSKLIYDEIVNS